MEHSHRVLDLVKQGAQSELPKVSIYMRTHRANSNYQQDATQFRNLVQEATKQLQDRYEESSYNQLLSKLETVGQDPEFWQQNKEGLVVLAANDHLEIIKLRQDFVPSVTVSEYYNVLPLLAYYDEARDVYIAELRKDALQMFVGNQYEAQPIEVEGIETSFYDIYDDMDSENIRNVARGGVATHGHATKSDNVEADRNKYFRYLDNELTKLSKEDQIPILLAGTAENIAAFKKQASSKAYLDVTIQKTISDLDNSALKEILAQTMGKQVEADRHEYEERLEAARGAGRIQSSLVDIEQSAQEGRVEELIVNLDRLDHSDDDRLHQVVENVIANGGKVSVSSVNLLNSDHQFEAILRY